MTSDDALQELAARADPGRVRDMEAYHKVARPYLGTDLPAINEIATAWRHAMEPAERVALAQALWATNVFEARVAAGKLLTQARIKDDGAVWAAIAGFVPEFDSWAIADHMSKAGDRRLVADPGRLDEVEGWVSSPHMWSRRAALVMTLPWTKLTHPKPEEIAQRERVLGWAAELVADREWFIQKAVGWWLRELSKRDPERVRAFLEDHGAAMKGFARREAAKYLD